MFVSLRGISKTFGGVRALDDATLELADAEVHVLAGENGAGKTSLMNVLAGVYRPDAGEVLVEGEPVAIDSPRAAAALGIGMVHQHFQLVPTLSALDNILLGSGGGWLLRRRRRRAQVEALARQYGLDFDLERPVGRLPVGLQQKVEILRALDRRARMLILDEPTTHLTPQEVDALFPVIRRLAGAGTTVVLITHKLEEMLTAGDRITVMRRGRVEGTLRRSEATRERIVQLLMGEPSPAKPPPLPPMQPGAPVLQLEALSTRGDGLAVRDFTLTVRSGEIVGLAGVAGNGQRELAEAIMALRPAQGRVLVIGRSVPASVSARIRSGIAYVPEDRLREGILPTSPLADSYYLALHQLERGWQLDETAVRRRTDAAIAEYRIAAGGGTAAAATLSGGNIQKLLVARAVELARARSRSLLLAMNPVRGLDLATTGLVHDRLAELRAEGHGVLLVSEDLDELMELCDRIAVIHRGRLAAVFERPEFDAYRIGAAMTGYAG